MEKQIKIALAGNPNSGKTTLFNALTGSNQFVGNWPGVTVEKKEGKLKKHDDVVIMDLPGIYSLSPYTLEEVVSRNYLITERPDAILNIVDGTNLERNLYLTTQLTELGIPVVVAINMMDVVKKNGDQINIKELSRQLGCPVLEISALKGTGIMEAAEAAVKAAAGPHTEPQHTFSGPVEHAIAHIEEAVLHDKPAAQQRWYAIKIFERDDKVLEQLSIPADVMKHIEADIKAAETELDDDAESIITNERYVYIAQVIKSCYKKKSAGKLSSSDKIDKIVTNRWLGLPIFAAVMFIVYWVAMVGVGAPATDWANDGLFGDGWHLLGIGSSAYNDAADEYAAASDAISGYYELDTEAEDFDAAADGLNACVVHPSGILGPNDPAIGQTTRTLIQILNGEMPIGMQGTFNLVDVRDLAAGTIAAADRGRKGKCYILSNDEVSLKELCEMLKAETGCRGCLFYLPLSLAHFAAKQMEARAAKTGKPAVLTEFVVYNLERNNHFDFSKAKNELGFAPRPYKETLHDLAVWLKQEGKIA